MILAKQGDLFSNSNTCQVMASDHHHFVLTMLNKKILKGNSKSLFDRDYKINGERLKSDSHFPKALFVLKIFKFFSWLFGHVRKTAWLER